MENNEIPRIETEIRKPLETEIIPRPEDPELQRLQEVTLSNFQQRGFLEVKRDDQNNIDSVVINHLDYLTRGFTNKEGSFVKRKTYLKTSAQELINYTETALSPSEILYWTFKGIPVTVKAPDGSIPSEKKNLFFVPSEKEGFSPETFAKHKNDHYIRMWDRPMDWDRRHPTVESDFAAKTSLLDIAIPYEVYARANGRRNEGGVLFVDAIPGSPEAGRQRLSGSWFVRQGIRGGGTDNVNWYNPINFMEEKGTFWENNELLSVEDFSEHNRDVEVRKVSKDGRINIGNRRFSIGSQYKDGDVVKIYQDQYAVSVDGEVRCAFRAHVSSENMRNCHITYDKGEDRSFTLVPQGSFDVINPSQLGSFFVDREGAKKDRIMIGDHVQTLMDFRSSLSSEGRSSFTDLSPAEQISAMLLVQDLDKKGDSRARELLETVPDSAQLFADAYLNGELDTRVLHLTNQSPEIQKNVIEQYTKIRNASNRFVDTLTEKLQSTKLMSNTDRIILERMKQSFAYRSQHFILLATEFGQEGVTEALDTMSLYTKALDSASNGFSGEGVVSFHEDPGIKLDEKHASVSARYVFSDSSRVTFTVRPEAVDEEYETGQSRLGVTASAEGKKVNLRLDCDEYGLSLDIGTRGSDFVNKLQQLGLSHHTQGLFEKGLSNKEVFKRFTQKIPKALGWKTSL
jgi:hypothetical protein